MKNTVKVLLLGLMMSAAASATTVSYSMAAAPTAGQYLFSFYLSGYTFSVNQELEIQFDPTMYSALSNGTAGTGFNVLLFQPDNRPGIGFPGYYSALATMNNPSLSSAFSVIATYIGTGTPGPQSYSINTYSQSGAFVSSTVTGLTTPAPTATPEPASLWLCVLGMFVGSAWLLRRARGQVR